MTRIELSQAIPPAYRVSWQAVIEDCVKFQGRDTEGDAGCSSRGGEQASEPCPCEYDRSIYRVCQDVCSEKIKNRQE